MVETADAARTELRDEYLSTERLRKRLCPRRSRRAPPRRTSWWLCARCADRTASPARTPRSSTRPSSATAETSPRRRARASSTPSSGETRRSGAPSRRAARPAGQGVVLPILEKVGASPASLRSRTEEALACPRPTGPARLGEPAPWSTSPTRPAPSCTTSTSPPSTCCWPWPTAWAPPRRTSWWPCARCADRTASPARAPRSTYQALEETYRHDQATPRPPLRASSTPSSAATKRSAASSRSSPAAPRTTRC